MLRKSIVLASAVFAVHGVGSSLARASQAPCGPPLSEFGEPAEESGSTENAAVGRSPASASRAIAKADADDSDSDDEYNFSWLDPDKKVYVVQNRKYRKKGHIALFVEGGLNLSNPYQTEYEVIPRAAYWFTEQFGLEVFYSSLSNHDNSTLTALQSVSASALPYVRQNRAYYGGVLTWTPFYSKMNFFNKILYFDWGINAGGGQSATFVNQTTKAGLAPNYVEQDLGTLFYGTDMMFYITRNFLVRLDLIGLAYNATGPDNVTTGWIQNYEFAAGIGWSF